MTHDEWQAQVVDLAHALGWAHLHVRKSIGKGRKWVTATNVEGWPDLFLWHPRHGFAAIECKVGRDERDHPERAARQRALLAQLARAGAATLMARPEDFDEVRALLSTGPIPEWAIPRPDPWPGDRPRPRHRRDGA